MSTSVSARVGSIFARARGVYQKITVEDAIAMGMSFGAASGLTYSCYDIYRGNKRDQPSYYHQDVNDSMIKSVAYMGAGATVGAMFAVTWPFAIPAAGIGAIAHVLTSNKDQNNREN